jgi:hypothetical protein
VKKEGWRQHYVTLDSEDAAHSNSFQGEQFPCPLCGAGLEIRGSRKNGKPYCICDSCGIQLFIRGKEGIKRLRELMESGKLGFAKTADSAIVVLNRLEQLKQQKAELENKRGLLSSILPDRDLENAIGATRTEIEQLQKKLAKSCQRSRRKK